MTNSATEIRCEKCGTDNRLPALHCRKCGAPLDYAKSERELLASGKKGAVEIAKTVLQFGVLFLLLGIAGLILWPTRPALDRSGEEIDARRYHMKGELLIDALNRGVARTEAIAARDMNAFFARQVKDSGKGGAMAAKFCGAGVSFEDGRGMGWVEMARGPFRLSNEFHFRISEGNRIRVTGAKMGHLPLPGALGRVYTALKSNLFRPFPNEGRILRNLASAELRDGELELTTAGRAE